MEDVDAMVYTNVTHMDENRTSFAMNTNAEGMGFSNIQLYTNPLL